MPTLTQLSIRADVDIERLINSACAGDAREVHRLMRKGLDPDTRDENGYPIVALAAVGNHVKTIAVLLRAGADANATDNEGNTPLRWAAEEGRLDAVGFLLEMGAEPNQPNTYGYTPLYWATENCKHAVVRLIRAHLDIRAGSRTRRFRPSSLISKPSPPFGHPSLKRRGC